MEDRSLGQLVELDGEIFDVSNDGLYWVKFEVHEVEASSSRPHGLAYSLTLHGPNDQRLVGFDTAHPVRPKKRGDQQDHLHVGEHTRPYLYRTAGGLLEDFWATVESVLRKRGIE